jgi:Protein of unknown function (DUF732)
MKRPLLTAATLGAAALVLAAPAQGDTTEFLDYLQRHAIGTSTTELERSDLDMGMAICNIFATAPPAGVDPNDDAIRVLTTGENPMSTRQAATWIVGSVDYLCPQYTDLLRGG